MESVTTSANQTSYTSPEGGSKAWHYLVGVLVTAILLSALTVICAKFKLFHKYFTSYSHHLLPEAAIQDNDTVSVSMVYDGNMKENRNQAMYPPEGLEEEDGYIEDNYIHMGAKSEDDEEMHVTI
ncbi:type III endosome membrane protein TEMP [Hypanus sabinus]|uniref:type III endosome membrane protein TEMP n=1 Tax=Hypanus sabinus TaxID=79690 RepID=UPI0028C427A8|nr:type III endosome membrane protein TEMP [Hypanus sabinus]XP_059839977.1 type III endosome membrane protein TEMP [Hypanus sabinus]XP_059839978.1 type III endosome membrane protein TEMP [Hypanus sabinus]